MDPVGLSERSHAEYVACDSIDKMIRENLVAERIAIESYREMIRFFGDKDSTTVPCSKAFSQWKRRTRTNWPICSNKDGRLRIALKSESGPAPTPEGEGRAGWATPPS